MRPARHVPELDGLRGVAITAVMLMHFVGIVAPHTGFDRAIAKVATYGVWGVDLFFVLSGFLITGILWDARGGSRYFVNFYARRTLRIFPLYYAVLLVIFVLVPAAWIARFDPPLLEARHAQLWVWPYLTNVYLARAGSFALPYISHFWSLAVEEHFYLVWPFVVGLLSRVSVMRTCVALGLGALFLRIILGYCGVNETAIFVLTPCRLDTLCAGAWLALAARGPIGSILERRTTLGLVVSGAAVLMTSVWGVLSSSTSHLALPLRGFSLALFFGFLIFAVCAEGGPARLKAALRTRFLRTLGKYSYGLYVYHGIISYWMHAKSGMPEYLTRALGSYPLVVTLLVVSGVGISMLVSVLSFEFFEGPLLKLKDRFGYTKGRADKPAVVAD